VYEGHVEDDEEDEENEKN